MKLQRVRLRGRAASTVRAYDPVRAAWIPLGPALGAEGLAEDDAFADLAACHDDVLSFLRGGERVRDQAAELIDRTRDPGALAATVETAPLLPFTARSFRDFSIYERHLVDAARQLAVTFMPPPVGIAIGVFERLTGRTFPALKPKGLFYDRPQYYMGNHTAFYGDGETVPWPSYANKLDYELELGFVLSRPVRDATPEEGRRAIGGFFLVNDLSARDTQYDEYRRGLFGPVVKAKGFANAMGATVITADELLPRWDQLGGAVRVNGEQWSTGTTAGARHDIGDMVAAASAGESLGPGDVLATGTLPGCCGLEHGRFLRPGDTVELELEELGTLRTTLSRSRDAGDELDFASIVRERASA